MAFEVRAFGVLTLVVGAFELLATIDMPLGFAVVGAARVPVDLGDGLDDTLRDVLDCFDEATGR